MNYSIDRLQPLTLGRVGDSAVRQIQIDCSAWINKYPELTTWYIQAVTPDGTLYTPVTKMLDNILTWTISDQDTALAGYGEYWVVAEGADGMKKTSASPPFIVFANKYSGNNTDSEGSGNTVNGGGECACDANALREELNTLMVNAESAAIRAEDAADRAGTSADQTNEAATSAEDAAEQAEESARSAEESAKLAQDSVSGLRSYSVIHGGGALFIGD